MNCKYHKDAEAKFICEKCKQPICEECSVDVMGNKVCTSCINQSLFTKKGEAPRGGFLEGFAFFCFACIPGASQMYMNLFKRGFQLMISVFGGIFISLYLNMESLIPLIIIPTWFFSFFDSYSIRRRLRNGELVEDTLIYDYNIVFRYKKYFGIAMLILGLLGVINAFDQTIYIFQYSKHLYWAVKRSIIPLLLVIAGVSILSKSKRKVKEQPETENQAESQG